MSTRRAVTRIVPASADELASPESNPLLGMTPEQRARETKLRVALYDALTALLLIKSEGGFARMTSGTAFAARRAAELGAVAMDQTYVPTSVWFALESQSIADKKGAAGGSQHAPRQPRRPRQPAPPVSPAQKATRKVWRFDPAQVGIATGREAVV